MKETTRMTTFQAGKGVAGRAPSSVSEPKSGPGRTPWSGGLTKEELAKPGGILLAMLTARANELGHALGEMAEHLNVTYGYISQLRTGVRKVENISDDFATACALYLGVPRMTVLLAAGRVRPEDVYEDTHETMATVPHALKFMQSDQQFGPMMPPEVFDAPLPMQFFIVQLYEAATGRKLLPGAHNAETAARQIKQLQEYRLQLQSEVDTGRAKKAIESQQRQDEKQVLLDNPESVA